MLNPTDAVALVQESLLPAYQAERRRLDDLDAWYRGTPALDPALRGIASPEARALRALCDTPWLRHVVKNVEQMLYVDGYAVPDGVVTTTGWDSWQRNDLDDHQLAVHRAALIFGYGYVRVTEDQEKPIRRAGTLTVD